MGIRTLLATLLLVFALPATATCPPADVVALADLRAGSIAENRRITVEGVVTGTFTGKEQLGGFFLQQRGNPPAGIFIYAPTLAAGEPKPGQRVQIKGRFTRFHGRPQMHRIDALTDCGYAGLPDPLPLRLPDDASRLPQLQDVKVQFPDPLTVTGNYELGRYGSLRLSADGRLLRRGASGTAVAREHAMRQIVLDDGSYRANPDPIPYLDNQGTRRTGDTVQGLTGVLTEAFGERRLHPTRTPAFVAGNPRPAPPPASAEALRVATLNVENYFVSLGQRGAASRTQLNRQRQKLVAAIHALDADVLSLIEVENRFEALADLATRINAALPERDRYRVVTHPASGTDAIQVALLYRPARAALVSARTDGDLIHNRPPLLAWLEPLRGGPLLGVVAVHFKAKVGCPETGDIDLGQGCWNRLRSSQAERLLAWLEQDRPHGAPVLIAGDINAYSAEDPVAILRAAGKRDLSANRLAEAQRYTYVFRGEAGQLDYLLAPSTLADRVVRAGVWHVNADEPPFLAYGGRQPATGPWRSSDHDPVWADIAWD